MGVVGVGGLWWVWGACGWSGGPVVGVEALRWVDIHSGFIKVTRP